MAEKNIGWSKIWS